MIRSKRADYQEVPEGQHIFSIYNDDQERLGHGNYFKSGRAAKEKLLYLLDAMISDEKLEYLAEAGINFQGAKPGDITVSDATPAYCPQGFFNTEEVLELVKPSHL